MRQLRSLDEEEDDGEEKEEEDEEKVIHFVKLQEWFKHWGLDLFKAMKINVGEAGY